MDEDIEWFDSNDGPLTDTQMAKVEQLIPAQALAGSFLEVYRRHHGEAPSFRMLVRVEAYPGSESGTHFLFSLLPFEEVLEEPSGIAGLPTGLIPFGETGDGGYFCFESGEKHVLLYSTIWPDPTIRSIHVASSFDQLLNSLVTFEEAGLESD